MTVLLRFTAIAMALSIFAFAGCDGFRGRCRALDNGPFNGMYGMGGPMMGILGLAVLVILAIGLYYFIKNKEVGKSADDTPLEILKKRYARGDITKEAFEQMKRDLDI